MEWFWNGGKKIATRGHLDPRIFSPRFCAASCNRALDTTRRTRRLSDTPMPPDTRVCVRGGDVSGGGAVVGELHSVRLSLAATRMRPPAARTHATHADSPPIRPATAAATRRDEDEDDAMRCDVSLTHTRVVSSVSPRISANNAVASPLLVSFSSCIPSCRRIYL